MQPLLRWYITLRYRRYITNRYKRYIYPAIINFYDAKRKYAPKEEGENAGEFLQLIPGGTFLPNPIKPSRSRSSKQKESAQETVAVNIELRTPTGTMMRISGNLTGRELKEIIIASSTHV